MTDLELLTAYHKVSAQLSKFSPHAMSTEKNILENHQESLIREGIKRGLIG